tara:strand:+ start:403 stop:582 length:180 start_codon:yes stop_codon:yes gene_type:complete
MKTVLETRTIPKTRFKISLLKQDRYVDAKPEKVKIEHWPHDKPESVNELEDKASHNLGN